MYYKKCSQPKDVYLIYLLLKLLVAAVTQRYLVYYQRQQGNTQNVS